MLHDLINRVKNTTIVPDMKLCITLLLSFTFLSVAHVAAQPTIQWQRALGGMLQHYNL